VCESLHDALTKVVFKISSSQVSSSKRTYNHKSDDEMTGLLITGGGRLPQILDIFQGLKSGCLGETSIYKIITTDNTTLWSKLESTW